MAVSLQLAELRTVLWQDVDSTESELQLLCPKVSEKVNLAPLVSHWSDCCFSLIPAASPFRMTHAKRDIIEVGIKEIVAATIQHSNTSDADHLTARQRRIP